MGGAWVSRFHLADSKEMKYKTAKDLGASFGGQYQAPASVDMVAGDLMPATAPQSRMPISHFMEEGRARHGKDFNLRALQQHSTQHEHVYPQPHLLAVYNGDDGFNKTLSNEKSEDYSEAMGFPFKSSPLPVRTSAR